MATNIQQVNRLGNPIVYVLEHYYTDQYTTEQWFKGVTTTLEEANEQADGYDTIYEYDLVLHAKHNVRWLNRQQQTKDALIALYKTGLKKDTYTQLDIYQDFQQQVTFDMTRDLKRI